MRVEKSAGAIIFRKEHKKIYFLLLHYGAGHWGFSKGHLEQGEDEGQAARREIKEETGIDDLKIIEGFKEQIKYVFRKTYRLREEEKAKAPLILKIVTFYLAETKTKDIKISPEHTEFRWLTYEQVLSQLTFSQTKKAFKRAYNFLAEKKLLEKARV